MRRTLVRCAGRGYRDTVAKACFTHARSSGDVSLCLYDVTTLYFEAEKEDDLRKVGFSKERRVDPQIVVGLLVDRRGFPLEIGCFEGNKAETATILPIIETFRARHDLPAESGGMVVVADAGCSRPGICVSSTRPGCGSLSAPGSPRPRWTWSRISVGTVTPSSTADHRHPHPARSPQRAQREQPEGQGRARLEPRAAPGSWRAVWAYSTKRAVRDRRTLTLQENRLVRSSPARRAPAPRGSSRSPTALAPWTRPPSPGHSAWSG